MQANTVLARKDLEKNYELASSTPPKLDKPARKDGGEAAGKGGTRPLIAALGGSARRPLT